LPDVRRTTAQPMKATLKAAISSMARSPTGMRTTFASEVQIIELNRSFF
jgi:hypothetical protein